MNGPGEQTDQTSRTQPAFERESTGKRYQTIVPITPFSAAWVDYALEDPLKYGGFAQGLIVKILYDTPEKVAEQADDKLHAVAGFTANYPITYMDSIAELGESGLVFRLAVDLKKNIGWLEQIVEDIKKLNNEDELTADTLAIIEKHLKVMNSLAEKGWDQVILATAKRVLENNGKAKDRLDLNLDYFTRVFPSSVFPLRVGEDFYAAQDFIPIYFPKGKLQKEIKFGVVMTNSYFYRLADSTFPLLEITFNRAHFDALNSQTGDTSKLFWPHTGAPAETNDPFLETGWPTIEEVIADLKEKLKKAGDNQAGDNERRRAMKMAERFIRMAVKMKTKENSKMMLAYEDAAHEIMTDVRSNLVGIVEGNVGEIEGMDPRSEDLDGKVGRALGHSASIDLLPGEMGDDPGVELMRTAGQKYSERAEVYIDDLEGMEPTDPKFKEKLNETLESMANADLLGSDESVSTEVLGGVVVEKFTKKASKLLEDMRSKKLSPRAFRVKSESVIESLRSQSLFVGISGVDENEIQEIADKVNEDLTAEIRASRPDAVNIAFYWNLLLLLGRRPTLTKEEKEIVTSAIGARLDRISLRQRSLSPWLKNVLRIWIMQLRRPLPPKLKKDKKVMDFVNGLRASEASVSRATGIEPVEIEELESDEEAAAK